MFPSIEHELLIHAADPPPGTRAYERFRDLLARDIDGDTLIDMAVKEGLACLLYRTLKRSGTLGRLTGTQAERLETLYHRTVLFNLKLITDLKQILYRLNQENIKVVLLQGMVLLELVYKKDIGLRPMTDIDFWALRGQYTRMIHILIELGFSRDPIYPNTFSKDSTRIDIHSHILWADRIKARRWLIAKGQESIYKGAGLVRVEGQEVLCLSRSDQVIYLCLHALKHRLDRLIWLVDVKRLLACGDMSDWEGLIYRARHLGQERTLGFILYLLQGLFDFTPPPEVREGLRRGWPNALEKRALRQRIVKNSIPLWGSFLLFSPPGGGLRRLALILETLFPGQEVLRQIFAGLPEISLWKLYWMRLLQILVAIKIHLKGS